jgi:hypothetical protein
MRTAMPRHIHRDLDRRTRISTGSGFHLPRESRGRGSQGQGVRQPRMPCSSQRSRRGTTLLDLIVGHALLGSSWRSRLPRSSSEPESCSDLRAALSPAIPDRHHRRVEHGCDRRRVPVVGAQVVLVESYDSSRAVIISIFPHAGVDGLALCVSSNSIAAPGECVRRNACRHRRRARGRRT